jgi:hypothetical protein
VIDEDSTVFAKPAEGYFIASGTNRTWTFTYTD